MAEVTQQPSGQIIRVRNQYRKKKQGVILLFEARHPSIPFDYMGWMDSKRMCFFYVGK
jgi:hypothetical protein